MFSRKEEKMNVHFMSLSAVFPIIIKTEDTGTQILLHRRENTGFQDSKWDIAGSGHVDKNETAMSATIRECEEELGISVNTGDLEFAHLSHRLSRDRTYYDIYFIIKAYSGTPTIMEPGKCSGLEWFPLNNLPADMIDCRKQDVQNYLNNKPYSEKVEN